MRLKNYRVRARTVMFLAIDEYFKQAPFIYAMTQLRLVTVMLNDKDDSD